MNRIHTDTLLQPFLHSLINYLSSLNMEILTVAVFVYLILISILDFLIWFLRFSLVLVSMEKIYQSLECFWPHFPTTQSSLKILRYASYLQLSSPCLVKHGLSYLIHLLLIPMVQLIRTGYIYTILVLFNAVVACIWLWTFLSKLWLV